MKRPIFYDTETTGVKHDRDHIIEIAAYDPEQDRTFESLINPGVPIPPDSTAIHNITDSMVADKPTFSEVGAQFAAFCEGEVVLVAHNNDSFDQLFLQSSFARHGLSLPQWTFFDTLKWARRYRPDLPRHTLQHLRECYDIASNNAHRALDDVIILHQVYEKLTGDLDIMTCIELIKSPKILRTMPFGKHQGKPLKDVPITYVRWLNEQGALDKPDNSELKMSFEQLGMIG